MRERDCRQRLRRPERKTTKIVPFFAGRDNISSEAEGERDWRAAGQKVTFCFARALDRDLFKNEVRRLLPADLLRFDGEGDNGPAYGAAPSSYRNNPA